MPALRVCMWSLLVAAAVLQAGLPVKAAYEEEAGHGPETDVLRAAYNAVAGAPELLLSLLADKLGSAEDYGEVAAILLPGTEAEAEPETAALMSCDQCLTLVRLVNFFLRRGLGYEDMRENIINFCIGQFNGTGLNSEEMCEGYSDLYGPHAEYVLNATNAPAEETCVRLQHCRQEEVDTASDAPPQAQALPKPQPSLRRAPGDSRRRRGRLDDAIRVAQITDIHVDRLYREGAATECGFVRCCRDEWQGEGSARRYGDQSCDIPPVTVELMLNFTRAMDVHYLMYTGDNNPGDQWQETQERQLDSTVYLANTMHRLLPDIPVYPVIGNHETFPTNLYYLERPEIQELNQVWLDAWDPAAQFPDDQKPNIRYSGFYTVLLRPGLRLIAYNSNYGYSYNWYNLLNEYGEDYQVMKHFLEDTFAQARDNDEKVLFVGHHPTGDQENMMFYSTYITDLAARYGDLIIFHIFGHYHSNGFKMIWDNITMEAASVELLLSSLTTSRNPSLRIFYLDPETFDLLDFEDYYMDLEKVSDSEPDLSLVSLMYRASDEYEMDDLSPRAWADLLQSFEEDDDLFQRYYRNIFTRNGPSYCDEYCKKVQLCNIRWANFEQVYQCRIEEGVW